MNLRVIEGGVTAAEGFTAAGVHCGVKSKNIEKKDLAIIYSSCICDAAATYTTNKVKAAPLYVTKEHLANGKAQAIVANSGNANACAPHDREYAFRQCAAAAAALGIKEEDTLVASTGVIGQTINIGVIEEALPALAKDLGKKSEDAGDAIMTTDTFRKEYALSFELGGKTIHLGAIAKGSGMIHPNMGTMLCFVTTDAAISSQLLQKALSKIIKKSFNRVSVDGDTSTNDMCIVLANGLAGNEKVVFENGDYEVFYEALEALCIHMARLLASDGEGASRLITCTVNGADSEDTAETLSKSVISSSLVKAAMFGSDANWGRVLCAMGYSGADFDPLKVDVAFSSEKGRIEVCGGGLAIDFDEDKAKEILLQKEIVIEIDIHSGSESATCWGCDLTYDYVKINGDYRT